MHPRLEINKDLSILEELKAKKLQAEGIVEALIEQFNILSTSKTGNQSKLDALRMNIQAEKTDLELTNQKIENENGREQNLQKAIEERKREEVNINTSLSNSQKDFQAASIDLQCLNDLENKTDSEIYSLLVPQTQRNQFKLLMSALFALMVLVVILGFFTVALRDTSVRSAIFSNQTGIQFVTLFSLVIAIILFGITEILQAKELSALLGGISGYILAGC